MGRLGGYVYVFVYVEWWVCVCVFACVPVSECKYLEHNSTFTKYHMVKESYVEDEQPMSPLNMIICFKCFNMFQSKILYASLNVT